MVMLVFSHAQVEKRKLFHIFLKQFLIVFRNWRPTNFGQPPEQAHYAPPLDSSQRIGDVVVGCYFGHPIEIILTLIEELSQITRLLADSKFVTVYLLRLKLLLMLLS